MVGQHTRLSQQLQSVKACVSEDFCLDKRENLHILLVLLRDRPRKQIDEWSHTVKKKDQERFKALLQEQRVELLDKARKTLEQDMALDVNELPDDMDFATSQSDQGMILRLRGREKTLLKKIDGALKRLEAGEFGICDECGDEIAMKRLEARPVTSLCIECKTEQERRERLYV
jgi:DnaK suppressor protein